MNHPSEKVKSAITTLLDELTTWERDTGRTSVLILREEGGFTVRAVSGNPVPEFWTDEDVLESCR